MVGWTCGPQGLDHHTLGDLSNHSGSKHSQALFLYHLFRSLSDLVDQASVFRRWKSTRSFPASGTMRLRQLAPQPPHRAPALWSCDHSACGGQNRGNASPVGCWRTGLHNQFTSRREEKRKQRSSREPPGILEATSTIHLPCQSQNPKSTCVAVPTAATTRLYRLYLTSILSAGLGPRLHPRTLPCLLLLHPLHNQACPHPHLLDMGV